MSARDGVRPFGTPTLEPDELGSRDMARESLSGRGEGRFPPFRALVILLVVLGLGLPVSYLASAYAHRQEHRWVAPTDQQYVGYLTGFAFARSHPMPDADAVNFDYCDAAAHRLKRTAGNWSYFSRGCQDATAWTPGDPPLRPMTTADFQADPR
jgi:hypothetical protein